MSSLNVKYYISIAANEFTFSVVTFSAKFCVFALWYFPITSWMKKLISNLYLLNKSYSQQVGSLAQRLDTQGNISHSVLHPSNVTNTEIHTLYKVWEKNSTSPALKTIKTISIRLWRLTLIIQSYTCTHLQIVLIVAAIFFLDQSLCLNLRFHHLYII